MASYLAQCDCEIGAPSARIARSPAACLLNRAQQVVLDAGDGVVEARHDVTVAGHSVLRARDEVPLAADVMKRAVDDVAVAGPLVVVADEQVLRALSAPPVRR